MPLVSGIRPNCEAVIPSSAIFRKKEENKTDKNSVTAEKGVLDLVVQSFKDTTKNWVKVANYTGSWFNYFSDWTNGSHPPEVEGVVKATGTAKNMLSALEVPGKVVETVVECAKFWKEQTLDVGVSVVGKATGVITNTCDTFELVGKNIASIVDIKDGTNALAMGSNTLLNVTRVNFTAAAIGSGCTIYENNNKIEQAQAQLDGKGTAKLKESKSKEITLARLKMTTASSYLTLGVTGIAATVFAAPVSSWVILLLATNGLGWSFVQYFYENANKNILDYGKNAAPADKKA